MRGDALRAAAAVAPAGHAAARQGVVQNFDGCASVTTVEGAARPSPGGPVASQEAIKELGTNGGGFFNANSAHPFENPDPITNFLEMLALLVIPFALTATYGRMVGSRRQGWALFAAMAVDLGGVVATAIVAEQAGNPIVDRAGADQAAAGPAPGRRQHGGQGGPLRHRRLGALRGHHHRHLDRRRQLLRTTPTPPSAGWCRLLHMLLGEVSPAGSAPASTGCWCSSLLAVFIAGLMVGRTPECLGKKIQAREVKLAGLAILVMPVAGAGPDRARRRCCDAGTSLAAQPGPARPDRDPVRVRLARPTTTARPSPASPPTRPSTT